MICIYSKIKVYTVGYKLGATLGLHPTLTSQVASEAICAVLSPVLMDTAWSLLASLPKAAVGTGEGLVHGVQEGVESWRGGWLSGCHRAPTLSPQSQLPHPFPNQYLKLKKALCKEVGLQGPGMPRNSTPHTLEIYLFLTILEPRL